jgi:hypothetical protein
MTTKTITFTQDQLFLLLDAMQGVDAVSYWMGSEDELAQFDKLYKRLRKAYEKMA